MSTHPVFRPLLRINQAKRSRSAAELALSVVTYLRDRGARWGQIVATLETVPHTAAGVRWTAANLQRFVLHRRAVLHCLLGPESESELQRCVDAEARAFDRVLLRIAKSLDAGQSAATVAHRFNAMRLPRPDGRDWTAANVLALAWGRLEERRAA